MVMATSTVKHCGCSGNLNGKLGNGNGDSGHVMMTSMVEDGDEDNGVNPGGMCCTGHATGREGHAICPILYPGHQTYSSNRYLTLHYITSECIAFASFYLVTRNSVQLVSALHQCEMR